MLIRILSEFQPRRGSDIAVKNCLNLSHRRMVQELLTSNDKDGQFHHQGMGVYFFEKSLSFLSPALCIVFEILKFAQKFGSKLGFFPKKLKEFPRNEENE